MAMATRGAELEALEEGSILDFFIRPTITRVPNVHEERIRVHMAISLLAEIESCGQAVPLECYARQNLLRLYRTSEQVRKDLELLVGLLPGKDKPAARSRAILTFSALVGAMSLARAVSDEVLSREILKTVADLLKNP